MNSKVITVVMPVYNKGPHVSRAIKSVLDQTYMNFILLIVDDASSDDSLSEIQRFNDPRIVLLNREQPGPGGYAARNKGIQYATTNWIAFVDADDSWENNHLEIISEMIERSPHVGIVGTSIIIHKDNDSKKVLNEYYNKYHKQISPGHIKKIDVHDFLLNPDATPYLTTAVCIKRDVLIAIDGFPAGFCRRYGDIDTFLRALLYCEYGLWSKKITATYHTDSVNMVTKNNPFESSCIKHTIVSELNSANSKRLKEHMIYFLNRKLMYQWIHSIKQQHKTKPLIWEILWVRVDIIVFGVSLLSLLPNKVSNIILNTGSHLISYFGLSRLINRG